MGQFLLSRLQALGPTLDCKIGVQQQPPQPPQTQTQHVSIFLGLRTHARARMLCCARGSAWREEWTGHGTRGHGVVSAPLSWRHGCTHQTVCGGRCVLCVCVLVCVCVCLSVFPVCAHNALRPRLQPIPLRGERLAPHCVSVSSGLLRARAMP